jgi:cell division protein FtsL
MRLNLILFFALIIFALALVNVEHQYRNHYSKWDIENKLTIDLKDEKTKLQIEESDKSGNDRINELAQKKLNMSLPDAKNQRTLK